MSARRERSIIETLLDGYGASALSHFARGSDDYVRAKLTALERIREQFGPEEWEALLFHWDSWSRPKQRPPAGDWSTWLVLAGRGFGKTRCGAEFIRGEVEAGRAGHIAIIGATAADVRDTIVEGESGILITASLGWYPRYEPSKRRLTWPNGAQATLFTAEEPRQLRGPNRDLFWADELAAWHEPQAAWDMLQFVMRLGANPRGIVTTTPRPIPIIRDLVSDPSTHVTKGSMYENAGNLSPKFLAKIARKYEGTRLGRQEIHAEVLEDNPRALWKQAQIDLLRVARIPSNGLDRIVVAVDPAVSSRESSNETGIIVCGRGVCGCKHKPESHGFTLADASGIYTPGEWAEAAVVAFETWGADAIVAEVNQGGDLVEQNIRTHPRGERIPVIKVHATRGKAKRAEPVAAMAERGEDHHVGTFAKLEDQMVQWDPVDPKSTSPDRMDAKVWGMHNLFLPDEAEPAKYERSSRLMPKRRM